MSKSIRPYGQAEASICCDWPGCTERVADVYSTDGTFTPGEYIDALAQSLGWQYWSGSRVARFYCPDHQRGTHHSMWRIW